jgi:hypothetical protein
MNHDDESNEIPVNLKDLWKSLSVLKRNRNNRIESSKPLNLKIYNTNQIIDQHIKKSTIF